MKELDLEALKEFDGKNGKPIYIVHEGKVYDVSESKLWKNGSHMRRHSAGNDLTTEFEAAPHGTEVFERYPQVGVLKRQQTEERKMSAELSRILELFPVLTRHPHPMTVHFPIVFMYATTIFNLLYLITGIRSFEVTAVHCLAAGILFIPIVMITGLFTWWLNYMARPIKPVVVKLWLSVAMWITAMFIFSWRMAAPGVVESPGGASAVYFILVIALTPMVSVIGWFGAKLTFPVEKRS